MDDDEPHQRKKSPRMERWKKYAEISDLGAIARRYFVMNAFDGALTMLGVVIGAAMSNATEPRIIIIAGVAGSFAMGVSGYSGAYMAESAERTKEIKILEKAMCKPMEEDSMQKEAARFATHITSLVDALSPAMAALIVISPYFMVNAGWMDMGTAFIASVGLTLSILAVLGMYLARITDENMIMQGVKMLMVGMGTAILCTLVSIGLGGEVIV
ncbi:MAG: VIT1/CCC1 transporter family protein [Thermoplasmata archaeon]|nr:VIT1/CCC1 transporter family protein [Thermoplasmata archaeon]